MHESPIRAYAMAWVVGASPEIRSQSKWRDVIITMLVPTLVAIIVVALRFWTRRRKQHSEDWITLGTMVSGNIYDRGSTG